MNVIQHAWAEARGWTPPLANRSAQLVLVFGAVARLRDTALIAAVASAYPAAQIIGCSTAGEICGTRVTDDSLAVTAIEFGHAEVRTAQVMFDKVHDNLQAGELLSRRLPRSVTSGSTGETLNLVHVLAFSAGLNVSGSELVSGIHDGLPQTVTMTGGLAGDGTRFGETLVLGPDGLSSESVVGVGLYGSRLRVGCGSRSGWDPFGPERLVTRSCRNVLFELDGRPALSLYKQYLGKYADGLPATGLLFPLSMRIHADAPPLVRTLLAIDERENTITLAGDIPEGAQVRLSKANVERLVDGAIGAAEESRRTADSAIARLAILVSCVGRKLVLKQRVEEEVEGVGGVIGRQAALTGFYSYGEIAPQQQQRSELHNQTMTVTSIAED